MINGIRFIIGNKCNYKCFYCHHEGVFNETVCSDFENKINLIYLYCMENGITRISVTGGEPLLYWGKLKYIIDKFNSDQFSLSINTNAFFIDKYINYFKNLSCKIEFHINVSSLNKEVHRKISGVQTFEKMLVNLKLLKDSNIKVCLNTILLNNINSNEITNLLKYCKENNFLLRLLQYLPQNNEENNLIINEKGLSSILPNVKVGPINSYGIFQCSYLNYDFEFVKNLCCDKLCDRCKSTSYIHFTPEMNIKRCMMDENFEKVDYSSYNTFKKAIEKEE